MLMYYSRISLLLYTGDTDSYRRACQEMLKRYRDTTDPTEAECTAKSCLLAANAIGDMELVQRLADIAAADYEQNHRNPWFLLPKSLAEYRAGKPASAIDWIQRFPLESPETALNRKATVFALLAMAHHGLNQDEDAAKALAEARKILDDDMPEPEHGRPFTGDWHDWLRAQILFCEANTLLSANGKKE
jgi:hypothetical protein